MKLGTIFALRALSGSGKSILSQFHAWDAKQDSLKTKEALLILAFGAMPVISTPVMMVLASLSQHWNYVWNVHLDGLKTRTLL